MLLENYEKKIETIKKKLIPLSNEERYLAFIKMGNEHSFFPKEKLTEEFIVQGCQSRLYLASECRDGKIFFFVHSDALISKGLAALLIEAYSGLDPETILNSPPLFLKELDLFSSLSPGRSNGLLQIYLKIKKLVMQALNERGSCCNS